MRSGGEQSVVAAYLAAGIQLRSESGNRQPGCAFYYRPAFAYRETPPPQELMTDQHNQPPESSASESRFKAEMPQIPGLSGAPTRRNSPNGLILVLAGAFSLTLAVLVGSRMLSKPRRADPPPTPAAQIEVPPPVPDLSSSLPVATEQDPAIARVGELSKPWDAKVFTFRNQMTGASVPALLIRLPGGSGTDPSGYWSVQMKSAFGNCDLEYVTDLQKLKNDYGFTQARHPMVGNPCSRTLFDPLKYAAIPGGVLSRGAIAQGTDLRPPFGIEIKIKGKDILATRME